MPDKPVDKETCAEAIRQCACFNFRKVSRRLTQLFDETLSPVGLRSTQLVVLLTVCAQGPLGAARLAEELMMDRSTLSRNLKPLLQRGFLEQRKAPGGRSHTIAITACGADAIRQAVPYWQRAQARVLGPLGGERWQKIRDDFEAIVNATRP